MPFHFMPKSLKRFFKIAGIIFITLAGIVFIGGYFLTGKAEQEIRKKLSALGIQTKSISVSLLNRSVELDSIVYSNPDTAINYPHHAFISRVKISGVHIIRFLKKKELIVNNLIISDGNFAYNKILKTRPDSSSAKEPSRSKINRIAINYILVTNIHASALNDTVPESSATINKLEVEDASVLFKSDTAVSMGSIIADLENLKQQKKGALHNFSVFRVSYDSKKAVLEVDSFKIYSIYNKTDFARIAKIQKTRLDILLPKAILEGINEKRFFTDSTLEIARIKLLKPIVHAYRDKHYPFVRDWIMPLPMEGIRRLPFKLKIDSILIREANIAYEEFSEKGLNDTGTITFNNLNGSFAGLSTELKNPDKKAFCTLVTDCQVMNNGSLRATFKFPLNSMANYEAYGNLRNMDLTSLNPALGNLSRIEIKKGTLNDLHFNFSYNDDVSTGEVLINYTDLKLQALKKEKIHEVNKLLSAAINAVVKSDKDKSVDKSKRIGVISIERDKKRFVFQLWWKSLLDGLQSTFLDNDKKKKARKEPSN
jgi:Domain of Unknown Function (DUF748)